MGGILDIFKNFSIILWTKKEESWNRMLSDCAANVITHTQMQVIVKCYQVTLRKVCLFHIKVQDNIHV